MEYKVRYNYSIGVYEIMRWNNHWEQTGYAFGTRKEAEKFVDNLKPNAFGFRLSTNFSASFLVPNAYPVCSQWLFHLMIS